MKNINIVFLFGILIIIFILNSRFTKIEKYGPSVNVQKKIDENKKKEEVIDKARVDNLFSQGQKYFIKTHYGTYLQANSNGKVMQTTNKGDWELWTIVKKYGFIYLYNESHKKFMRINSNGITDLSAKKEIKDLPNDWTWEKFHIVKSGADKYGLFNPHNNKVVKAESDKSMVKSNKGNNGLMPNNWTLESFELINLEKEINKIKKDDILNDGDTVTITSYSTKKQLSATENDVVSTDKYELWTVIKKYGYIYFYSNTHKKFLKMSNTDILLSDKKEIKELPSNWESEKFVIIPSSKKDYYGLWNPIHNRFVRARQDNKKIDTSDIKYNGIMPKNWTWELFKFTKIISDEKYNNLKKTCDSDIKKRDTDISSKNKEIGNNKKTIDNKNTEIKKKETDIMNKKKEIEKITNDIKNLTSSVNILKEIIEVYEKEFSVPANLTKEQLVDYLVKNGKKMLDVKCQTTLNTKDLNIKEKEKMIETKKTTIKELENNLNKQIAKCKSDIKIKEDELKNLDNKMKKEVKSSETNLEKINQQKKEIENKEKNIKEKNKRIDEIMNEMTNKLQEKDIEANKKIMMVAVGMLVLTGVVAGGLYITLKPKIPAINY